MKYLINFLTIIKIKLIKMRKRRKVGVLFGETDEKGNKILSREIDDETGTIITTVERHTSSGTPYVRRVEEHDFRHDPARDLRSLLQEERERDETLDVSIDRPYLFYEIFDHRYPKDRYVHIFIDMTKYNFRTIPVMLQRINPNEPLPPYIFIRDGLDSFVNGTTAAERGFTTTLSVQCKFLNPEQMFDIIDYDIYYNYKQRKPHLFIESIYTALSDLGRFLDPREYPLYFDFKTYLYVPEHEGHISLPFIFDRHVRKPHMDMIKRDFVNLLHAQVPRRYLI